MKKYRLPVIMLSVAALSACAGGEAKYPTGADRAATGSDNIYEKPEGIFGKGGLFGGRSSSSSTDGRGENGIAVNSYLWRASLDTVSFMPLVSADPFGGTIITDWYADPSTPNERTKLTVLILGRELKADGVKVQAFRQVKKGSNWVGAAVAPDTSRRLEDAILTRARQMRVQKEDGLF
jgi:hypothetical protein